MTERDKQISDWLVGLVQIIFGFVLAEGLSRYDSVIRHPISGGNFVATLALFTIYMTSTLSWIDWHRTMALNPYVLNPKGPDKSKRLLEELRLVSDLLVVLVYSIMLLAIEEFKGGEPGTVELFLRGFPIIFLVYLFSGILRRLAYGPRASSLNLILIFGLAFAALWLSYGVVDARYFSEQSRVLDGIAIALAAALMVSYRWVRRVVRASKEEKKRRGHVIGVDVDGVLSNQIWGILPILKRKYGTQLTYEDITEWALPVGPSDLALEISQALRQREYLASMPVHPGARAMVDALYERHRVVVITARPPEATSATEDWLRANGFSFDEFVNVKESGKSAGAVDVLIDDFPGNIREHLSVTNGKAVLVDQPWNRRRDDLQAFIAEGRLLIAERLDQVFDLVEGLLSVPSPGPVDEMNAELVERSPRA